MKTKKNLRQATIVWMLAGLALSAPIQAGHRHDSDGAALTHVSPAYNNAIYGYRNVPGAERPVPNPSLTYVDQAYGQAIYSYPRVGRDSTVALETIYVSPAFGQAIYSYPRNGEPEAAVEVLPDAID